MDELVAWEIWASDLFDRESSPTLEASGRGIVDGLVELWARYLFEYVRKGGGRGFTDFQLYTDRRVISIDGDMEQAARVRAWVFGDVETTTRGVMAEANLPVVKALAEAHVRCLTHDDDRDRYLGKQYSAPVIAAAANAQSVEDFIAALTGVC